MGDISVPHSLASANAGLSLAESLARLLDPAERKKIADDVCAHNALNDTEAKKAQEAREMIQKHQVVLDETRALEGKLAKEKSDFEQEKIDFKSACDGENKKIGSIKADALAEQEKAKKLLNQIEAAQASFDKDKREMVTKAEQLKKDNEKLVIDRKKLDDELKKAEEIKSAALKLQSSMQIKLEEARRFNL